MAPPVYSISVAWTTNLTGVFTVGTSLLGGTDVLGGAFGGNVFDDITSHVQAFEINRGRSDDLGAVEQGTLHLDLTDLTGRFNPENPTSDLYDYLVPMRPVRFDVTVPATPTKTYTIFRGFIERIEHDPLTRTSTIDCVDLFEWLSISTSPLELVGITSVGDAIERYLDAIEFTDPGLRSIDAGRPINLVDTTHTTDYLGGIQDVVAYDRGIFFITGDGIARYISGENYWAEAAFVNFDFDPTYTSDLKAAVDKQRINNRVTVLADGGTPQTAVDTTSTGRYGFRDGAPLSSSYLSGDTEALALARWIVAIQKDPTVPTRGLEVVGGDDARVAVMFSLDIGFRVLFSEDRGGTNSEGIIEGLQTSGAIGELPRTRFLISKRRKDAFTIGRSLLDGTDILYW